MALFWTLLLYQTLTCFICLSISYHVYRHVTIGAARRRFIASKGCKPIPKWRNKDPILGIDFLAATYRAIKEHRALEVTKGRFDLLGVHTAHINILTSTFIATVEPENLKYVLANDFQSYSLGKQRKQLLRPLFGDGIFTTDGDEWVLSSFFPQKRFPWLHQWSLIHHICKSRVSLLSFLGCSMDSFSTSEVLV